MLGSWLTLYHVGRGHWSLSRRFFCLAVIWNSWEIWGTPGSSTPSTVCLHLAPPESGLTRKYCLHWLWCTCFRTRELPQCVWISSGFRLRFSPNICWTRACIRSDIFQCIELDFAEHQKMGSIYLLSRCSPFPAKDRFSHFSGHDRPWRRPCILRPRWLGRRSLPPCD